MGFLILVFEISAVSIYGNQTAISQPRVKMPFRLSEKKQKQNNNIEW